MFKHFAALTFALLAFACDEAPSPTAPAQLAAAPAKGDTAPRSYPCSANRACSADNECDLGMVCNDNRCTAPCVVDAQCWSTATLPGVCGPGYYCVTPSGTPSCPAPCPAGESCSDDADCTPDAPHCEPSKDGKGICVLSCDDPSDCAIACVDGRCVGAAGSPTCE